MEKTWSILGLLALGWTAGGLTAGGTFAHAAVSLGLALLSLTCAVHEPTRRVVLETALNALSKNTLMTVATVFAAICLVQFLPIEMAFWLSGEVLAYLDALAAISMVAAVARSRSGVTVLRKSLGQAISRKRDQLRAAAARARRTLRKAQPAGVDEDTPGWAASVLASAV